MKNYIVYYFDNLGVKHYLVNVASKLAKYTLEQAKWEVKTQQLYSNYKYGYQTLEQAIKDNKVIHPLIPIK
jgi:hypothetical protein